MSETQNVQVKQPMDPNKKRKITQIITFVGGGVGIIALILFGLLFTKPTAKVYFYGKGINYEEVVIKNDGTIDFDKTPTLTGYDFKGWYDNKDFSGNPIDPKNDTFLKKQKTFRWFGKMVEQPITTDLFAKWEVHKYMVEVLDYETKEKIVIYDEDSQPIENLEFYITHQLRYEDDIEAFQKDYANNISGGADKIALEEYEKLLAEGENLAMAEVVKIEQIWNFHFFNGMEDLEFVDEEGNKLPDIKRADLKIELDEEGNEKPILTVYVKNYPNE